MICLLMKNIVWVLSTLVINAIDEKFNIYLGDYYFDNNDYNNAKKYYSACLHNDLCDSSYVNKKLAEINMKGE